MTELTPRPTNGSQLAMLYDAMDLIGGDCTFSHIRKYMVVPEGKTKLTVKQTKKALSNGVHAGYFTWEQQGKSRRWAIAKHRPEASDERLPTDIPAGNGLSTIRFQDTFTRPEPLNTMKIYAACASIAFVVSLAASLAVLLL